MIIIDQALRQRASAGCPPIRVGMIGAGFMARGIAMQVASVFPTQIQIAAICNRDVEKAQRVYATAGAHDTLVCVSAKEVREAIAANQPLVTCDPILLAQAEGLDVLLEVTGTIEPALPAILAAIEARKHIVLMNAELDGTLGCLLKAKADAAGVVYTNVDGDQPGVIMNLYRFVRGLGVRPVLCGNIKGLQDPYRNPTTQAAFAARWAQNPKMVTSFADGTKISFEQAIVANATGMRVGRRGMYGFSVDPGTPIEKAAKLFQPVLDVEGPGLVDYVVGASPGPGVFVLGTVDDPRQREYLELYKLGAGPLYCFYTPYHLCHFEVPNTILRACLFRDAAVAPLGPPVVEVVAVAKRDLERGEILDSLGGYTVYGVAENAPVVMSDELLPIGVATGCRLVRSIAKDVVLTYRDVELPPSRLCDSLRQEQAQHFCGASYVESRTAAGKV